MVGESVNSEITKFHLLCRCATKVVKVVSLKFLTS